MKHIDNIKAWTDAFINFAKIVIQRHPLLASDLFSYIALIRGVVTDAPFERVYQYDQQFRLRVAQSPTKKWSQIDGNSWFRFIAKGAYGEQSPPSQMLQRCCYDYYFKKGCFRMNCTYRHACLRCHGMHRSAVCVYSKTMQNNQHSILEKHSKATYSKSNKTIFSTGKITILTTCFISSPYSLLIFSDNNIHRFEIWKLSYSPICVADLDKALQLYSDRETATLLSNGF